MAKSTNRRNQPPSAQLPQNALDEIDRVFHEKARLGIMTAMLGQQDPISFNDLKEICRLTDGNLNRHLKVLLEANAVSVEKTGRGRATKSSYRVTRSGRIAFEKYLDALEQVLLAANRQRDAATTKQPPVSRSTSGNFGLES